MNFLIALRSPPVRWVWLFVLTAFPLLVLMDYLAVAPVGSKAFLQFKIPYVMLTLATIPAILVLPVIAIWWRRRAELMAWWLVCLIFTVAVIGGMKVGYKVRQVAFDRLAERSTALVQAIKTYEKDHGQAPTSLEALVPKYLPAVPSTGMMGYPKYHLYTGSDTVARYEGNPWVLIVNTSAGFSSFDQFMYFPLQNYPETGYGGRLQRMRGWAYLHE